MASSSQARPRKSQKRKSSLVDPEPARSEVTVQLGESHSSAGPCFINFPSVRPSRSTPWTLYSRDVTSTLDLTKQATLIAGETEDVEFFSTNRNHGTASEGFDCSYLPAVYDPSTSTLHIHPSSPLFLVTHRVKRLRNASLPSAISPEAKIDYRMKRNDLGETFGTKKAKSQIKAAERNKVDVGAMQGIKGHLMESIGEMVVDDGPVAPSDLIPTPNLTTTEPSEVYPRDSLIPSAEFSSIDVSNIMRARDDKGRSGSLPWRRSRWIEDKMRVTVLSTSSGTTKKAILSTYHFSVLADELTKDGRRTCYYLSTLLLLNDLSPTLHRIAPAELPAKFPGVPQQLVNGCISRFTESQNKRYTVTDRTRTMLLAWICVLYLSLNEWAIPVGTVASDLKLPPGKVGDMFKSLGCNVDVPSPAEREKAGLSLAEAQKNKKAVLKAPVEFPQIKRRGLVKR